MIIIVLAVLGCTSLQSIHEQPLCKGPMPLIDEDVLWVSSIPLGATVFIFEKHKGERFPLNPDDNSSKKPETPQMQMQTRGVEKGAFEHKAGPFSRKPVGITPLAVQVPPGTYCVGIQLDVSSENVAWQFFTKGTAEDKETAELLLANVELYANLGENNVGLGYEWTQYQGDGNLELWALVGDGGLFKKVGKTYEVEKKLGEAATIIALFQLKDEDPAKIYETLPEGYRFKKRLLLTPKGLEIMGVPRTMSKQTFKRLMHGGKVLLCNLEASFMCELTPLGPSPGGGEKGGFRMTKVGEFSGK